MLDSKERFLIVRDLLYLKHLKHKFEYDDNLLLKLIINQISFIEHVLKSNRITHKEMSTYVSYIRSVDKRLDSSIN
ncbi:hypothetical protein J2S17_004432 [Cytobacillus purgationiresistens]|uniref:Uncharacterized protein n=1 Tax=Cytobacillus purgationiresistens TaxID=863449 RepID=A0ABU0AR70_9BACI|nr:hypothetical protein [Cytobacillus purgationiresistens]